ncbi:hypothetical protein BX667DRAFT_324031 [Coemansia mojavensis]|nr:hypothetical protein BX667DRAFT_324031 [Coemansia mojavensis]
MSLFRKHQGDASSSNPVPHRSRVSEASSQSNPSTWKAQEKQQRPVALRVAQAAAKVARILSIRKHTPNQPTSSTNHLTESAFSFQKAWPQSRSYSSATSTQAAESSKHSLQAPTCVRTNQPHADIKHKAANFPGRLIQTFPEIASEFWQMHSFVCSLDHARVRWYGRIYICTSCVCFTGTGISLSAAQRQRPLSWLGNESSSSLQSCLRQDNPWFASYQSIPQVCASAGSHRQSLYASIGPSMGKASTWPRQTRSNSAHGSTCIASRKPWRRMAIKIPLRDITRVNKELTLGFCPNAITIATAKRHYIFTNFVRRDRAFSLIDARWHTSNACSAYDNPVTQQTVRKAECPQHLPPLVDTQSVPTMNGLVEPSRDYHRQRSRKPLVFLMREQYQKEPLDPIGLLSQLIGSTSRNTMFVLLSVLVFCLLALFL